MESFQQYMDEYCEQLRKGVIQKAYKGLMEYIMKLRTYFRDKYPEYCVPSSTYYGYMDMTYFPLFPTLLKDRGLKIAIVFVHEACKFEVWLAATNKQVQKEYWQLMKDSHWDKYQVLPSLQGEDAILISLLVENPNFVDLDALTNQIEQETVKFIKDIENFLSAY